jgi:SMI1-KNR4 cell-wall
MNMSRIEYHTAINLLTNSSIKIDEPEPIPSNVVELLEARLNTKLPHSYKQMIVDFGSLSFGSKDIYGIIRLGMDVASAPNVVFATEDSRSRSEITDKMIEIMPSGYGTNFVLDCGQLDQRGEAPVYEINELGYKHGMKKVADSFGEFLLNEVRMTLANR